MKIDSTRAGQLQQGQQIAGSNADRKNVAEVTEINADRISISSEAQQFATARALFDQQEAQRSARVEEIKAQVEGGSYSVSTDKVAESFLQAVRG